MKNVFVVGTLCGAMEIGVFDTLVDAQKSLRKVARDLHKELLLDEDGARMDCVWKDYIEYDGDRLCVFERTEWTDGEIANMSEDEIDLLNMGLL